MSAARTSCRYRSGPGPSVGAMRAPAPAPRSEPASQSSPTSATRCAPSWLPSAPSLLGGRKPAPASTVQASDAHRLDPRHVTVPSELRRHAICSRHPSVTATTQRPGAAAVASNGTYTISALPPGTSRSLVQRLRQQLVRLWYRDASLRRCDGHVQVGTSAVTGIDVTMHPRRPPSPATAPWASDYAQPRSTSRSPSTTWQAGSVECYRPAGPARGSGTSTSGPSATAPTTTDACHRDVCRACGEQRTG